VRCIPDQLLTLVPLRPPAEGWFTLDRSIGQFSEPIRFVPVLLALLLAVACAWLIARHPSRPTRADVIRDSADRKVLLLLGIAGAMIALLVTIHPLLAFALIGAGLAMRLAGATIHPKLAVQAIIVVLIGICCGLGQWALALLFTLFVWFALFWLDAHSGCRIRIHLSGRADLRTSIAELRTHLVARQCRVTSIAFSELRRRVVIDAMVPSNIHLEALQAELHAKLPTDVSSDVSVRPR